jgi:PKD repeat protein
MGGPPLAMVTPMAPNIPKSGVLATLALLATALLSGCAGVTGGGDDGGNIAPVARLEADKDNAWAGEEIAFDAQDSEDPDGNVTEWRFDFGDGTRVNVTDEDAARVSHAYARGGEYEVSVTVVDDGEGGGLGEKASTATVQVAVDERSPVAANVIRTALTNNSAASRMEVPFDVREGADRTVSNVTVQNVLVAGASEVRLVLRDPSGDVLKEQTYTLNSTEPEEVEFEADVDDDGAHVLEVLAVSGAARVTGFQETFYGDDLDLLKDDAGEDG